MIKMRYKITIEYDGTNYCGWQKQNGKFSIQESIEKSIQLMTHEVVEVYGCGRTDAGVHAIAITAHFDLEKDIETHKLISGINYYLKNQYISRLEKIYYDKKDFIQDISIIDCEKVDNDFHSRFSAKMRYYKYIILNRQQPTALYSKRVWQVFKKLNFDAMNDCLQYLIGKKDWSSFRDSDCQANTAIKTISGVSIIKDNDKIIFTINAKSFLHHIVRNIVGTLVEVGLEKISVEDFKSIIEAKDRKKAGPTAPPQGLYFVKVDY